MHISVLAWLYKISQQISNSCTHPDIFGHYPHVLTLAMCFQLSAWTEDWSILVSLHLTQFDDDSEFELSLPNAECFREFLQSVNFHPFLAALDTDAGRVASRAEKEHLKFSLHDRLEKSGKRELHRWWGLDADYDEEEYNDTPFPMHPIPIGDWVELETSIAQGEGTGVLVSSLVHSMARYMHSLHYKVDMLKDQLRAMERAGPRSGDWTEVIAKFPFLSDCDDHVRQTPNTKPMLLSRTSAVTPSFDHSIMHTPSVLFSLQYSVYIL